MNYLKFCLTILLIAIVGVVFAQPDTVVIVEPDAFPEPGSGFIDYVAWVGTYLGVFTSFLLVLELLLSALPTNWDLSILTNIRRVLDQIGDIAGLFKNNRSTGGQFKVKSEVVEKKKND